MKFILALAVLAVTTLAGCQRIETGEVGLRVGFDKQVNVTDQQPGSFNQVLIGDVLTFPVKQIGLQVENMKPQTNDNSTLSDLDITVIYNVNPAAVGELYTKESRAFHGVDAHGETLLMYSYLNTLASSSATKAVSKYDALGIASKRADIETDIARIMTAVLAEKKLDGSLSIAQVQVKNILPAQSIIDSANAVISQQNALRAKQIEVDIAIKESERLSALSKNVQNIQYMNAKALQDIAEGVKAGKVQSIVVPYDFKGIVNVGK